MTKPIIRQVGGNAAVVLLIAGIETDYSLIARTRRKFIKRGELFLNFRDRLLQHLAVPEMSGGLQLMQKAFAGK